MQTTSYDAAMKREFLGPINRLHADYDDEFDDGKCLDEDYIDISTNNLDNISNPNNLFG